MWFGCVYYLFIQWRKGCGWGTCECNWLFMPSQNTVLPGTLRNDCKDQSSVKSKMKAHLLWCWGIGGGNLLEPPKFKNGTFIVTCWLGSVLEKFQKGNSPTGWFSSEVHILNSLPKNSVSVPVVWLQENLKTVETVCPILFQSYQMGFLGNLNISWQFALIKKCATFNSNCPSKQVGNFYSFEFWQVLLLW